MRDMFDARERGDFSFKDKYSNAAIIVMKALISVLRFFFFWKQCPQIYQPNVADSSFPCVSQFVDVGTMGVTNCVCQMKLVLPYVWPTWCCPPWCHASTDRLPWLANSILHAVCRTIQAEHAEWCCGHAERGFRARREKAKEHKGSLRSGIPYISI